MTNSRQSTDLCLRCQRSSGKLVRIELLVGRDVDEWDLRLQEIPAHDKTSRGKLGVVSNEVEAKQGLVALANVALPHRQHRVRA
jgi:hypothetical protein